MQSFFDDNLSDCRRGGSPLCAGGIIAGEIPRKMAERKTESTAMLRFTELKDVITRLGVVLVLVLFITTSVNAYTVVMKGEIGRAHV